MSRMNSKKIYMFAVSLVVVFVCASFYNKGERLEENDYIMALLFDVGEDGITSTYESPILKKDEAQAVLYGEQKITSYNLEHFQDFSENYKNNTSRDPDFQHLKVLLIGENLLKDEKQFEVFIKFLKEQEEFAQNVYIAVDASNGQILEQNEDSTGNYLESLFDKRNEAQPLMSATVGKLLAADYNKNQVIFIPVISNEKKIEGEWIVAGKRAVTYTTEEDAKWLMTANCIDCGCELYFQDIYGEKIDEEQNFSVEVSGIKRQISFRENNDKVYADVLVTVKGRAKDYCGDLIEDTTILYNKQEIFALALSHKLQSIAKISAGEDLFNTYYELSNKDRTIWKKYRNSYDEYIKDFVLDINVSADFMK